jgi:sterol desaturase/sphingolipid hydroxylase (fatty acid hydroxylase superfamily)
MKHLIRKFISYGLYPTLLIGVLFTAHTAIHNHWDYKMVYGIVTIVLVLTLVSVERIFPLSPDWSMTKKSLWRDLKYIFVDAPTIAITKTGFGLLAIYYSETHRGFFSNAPILLSVLGFLLVFEFFQYWYHRLSHTGKGRLGNFLWKVHVAHHLPDKVYVVMHAVFNPINAFLTATIIQMPLILLGISPEAALIATLLIDLQSLVSHFNADIRAGFLNYIFIGTETHRYHHSADIKEAQNFGNTLAIWDIVFGTFYYRPNESPAKLGIDNSNHYPNSDDLVEVILFPFKK